MITKVKRVTAVIISATFLIGIVACSMRSDSEEEPINDPKESQLETELEEPEAEPAQPDNYDIAAGMKIEVRGGAKVLKTDHLALTLTHADSWNARVNNSNSITIYNTALNKAGRGGKLVTILAFSAGDSSYEVLPDYNIIGESDGIVYIAAYPTDVQFEENDKKSAEDYLAVYGEVSKLSEGADGNPMTLK